MLIWLYLTGETTQTNLLEIAIFLSEWVNILGVDKSHSKREDIFFHVPKVALKKYIIILIFYSGKYRDPVYLYSSLHEKGYWYLNSMK